MLEQEPKQNGEQNGSSPSSRVNNSPSTPTTSTSTREQSTVDGSTIEPCPHCGHPKLINAWCSSEACLPRVSNLQAEPGGTAPGFRPVVPSGAHPGLTFAQLHDANLARCGRWHPGFPGDETWTGSDWSNAIGGEAGELAEAALAIVAAVGKLQNTTKKIRRYETGTHTARDKPLEQLWAEFDAEMADVACYLDLLATKYGRDLAAAIVAKFNAVSDRQGFREHLVGHPAGSLSVDLERTEGDLAVAIREATITRSALQRLGVRWCRSCGCVDDHCTGCVERTGQPCAWVEPLDVDANLCTACVP